LAYYILVINPGSTSTKLAIFKNSQEHIQQTQEHRADELKAFKKIVDQTSFRLDFIHRFLKENNVEPQKLDAVAGRGGLLKPIPGGVYQVNQTMLDDLNNARFGEHASNLGAILSHRIAQEAGCEAYIVDPVVVDEMEDIARVSGMPEIQRKSIFHALSQKSAAREVAQELHKTYEECNFIVAHLGGGISVGAHYKGRVVDVNNALDGDGPFSPERSGGLPVGQLAQICFSGIYTLPEMKEKIVGKGGLVAYRGSNSLIELKKAMIAGDKNAELLYESMAYKISQEIAKHSATLKGKIDAIVITGGMANDETFVNKIRERVGHIAKFTVVSGEKEMLALASNVLAVLKKEKAAKKY
jgi:butyrate kinase